LRRTCSTQRFLGPALQGIEVVFYLVHSMEGDDFENKDRVAAENLLRAAESAGVKRIVYLSGLGRADQRLSKHLQSRQEIGALLASGSIPVVELRCGGRPTGLEESRTDQQ
jgi:uncharacterized protein YbjT (DUF2867 family)